MLACSTFSESWCIPFSRSSHQYKFGLWKGQTLILVNNFSRIVWWSVPNSFNSFKSTFFRSSYIILICSSNQYKSDSWNLLKFVILIKTFQTDIWSSEADIQNSNFTVFQRTCNMLQHIPWDMMYPIQKQKQQANTNHNTWKSKNLTFSSIKFQD